MGNRAVITAYPFDENNVGVYLHWNGGRDSVEAFLTYCRMKGYRPFDEDCYGYARLCQVIGNFFGGELSIGIDRCDRLDCDNYDNGVYLVKDWRIVGRMYNHYDEQNNYDLRDCVLEIDNRMPESERIGEEKIDKFLEEYDNPF